MKNIKGFQEFIVENFSSDIQVKAAKFYDKLYKRINNEHPFMYNDVHYQLYIGSMTGSDNYLGIVYPNNISKQCGLFWLDDLEGFQIHTFDENDDEIKNETYSFKEPINMEEENWDEILLDKLFSEIIPDIIENY